MYKNHSVIWFEYLAVATSLAIAKDHHSRSPQFLTKTVIAT
jgi:hypothetical protein